MGMGRRKHRQDTLWVATAELPRTAGHVFYERVNRILNETEFDRFVEDACEKFYAAVMGWPSLAPGKYFRMLLVGYFEGIDSERGIAWRCADSLSLREFLGVGLSDAVPDHSTVSRTRRLIDLETHGKVFSWMLGALAGEGLIDGKTVGVDASTLEANAAMRSIVRRDTGEAYNEFLTRLPRRRALRRRPERTWPDWTESEPRKDRTKSGNIPTTRRAHYEDEGRADASGAQGRACRRHEEREHPGGYRAGRRSGRHDDYRRHDDRGGPSDGDTGGDPESKLPDDYLSEIVADKGYHSNDTMTAFKDLGIRRLYLGTGTGVGVTGKASPPNNRPSTPSGDGSEVSGQAVTPTAGTDVGTAVRAHSGNRSHASGSPPTSGQHSQAHPDSVRRVESEPDSSEQFRERHTARPSGPVCCCLVHPDTALEPLSIALFRS